MSKIIIIGEAWGEEEARQQTPFVGKMSWQLTPMLEEAGLHRADIFLTNVFNLRYDGKIEVFCGGKKEALPGYPPLFKGKYVRAEFLPELERLANEILEIDPNLIIACGNTPLWALCGKTGISKLRGTTMVSSHTVTGYKCLPTYHPAAIIHQWELRPTTVLDLQKAKREAEYPEIRRPKREIWIEPSLEDMERFYAEHIVGCRLLSVDIETAGNQITCIGFAPSPALALVVPFADYRKKNRSYWNTFEEEKLAWMYVKKVCESDVPKVGQNILFDTAFCWRSYGIKIRNIQHDDMLLHHALHPESLKGLGYLSSVYLSEGHFKDMRKATIKRDD